MAEDIIGNDPITMRSLRLWGYCPFKSGREYFVNWNGVWLRQTPEGIFEYGDPNYHTIDDEHPFIKRGEVKSMEDLNKVNGRRGLEYKIYKHSWK